MASLIKNYLVRNSYENIMFLTGEGHPEPQKLTYAALRNEVAVWASALRHAGPGLNDSKGAKKK